MQRLTDARRESSGSALGGEALPPRAVARPAAPPTPVERALATMRGPLDRPLPLATLAEIAGLSPFHFARTFRQATGIPPGQFLAALRLEQAKRLLLTTDLTVTEICFAVGYDSIGTFTTRFTQFVGLPPGQMRRLPETLGEALARLPADRLMPPTADLADTASGVVGRIGPDVEADTLIFVGLFPGAIPQGRPVVGMALAAPGPFRLPAPPDGRYHLLAAAVPHPQRAYDATAALLPGAALRVGRAPGTLVVRGGRGGVSAAIALRPPQPTAPPVLVALPALLLACCPRLRPARDGRN